MLVADTGTNDEDRMTGYDDFTMTIDGQPVSSQGRFAIINPSNGREFASAPDCSPGQLDLAMQTAQQAFSSWRQDEGYRVQVLHEMADAVAARADEIGRLQTLEGGRPLEASADSVRSAARRLHDYADLEVPRLVVRSDDRAHIEVFRRPVGVVGVIKPWNGPATNVLNAIGPIIRAGNTVVFKPSPYTPLSALAIGEVIRRIVPPGVVNIVSGRDPLGHAIVVHPVPRGIFFTGSTATGRLVNTAAASDFKRMLLELGGNDPAIVLDDIDPDAIAERLFWAAFRNSGQVCMAVKRVYVPERLHLPLAQALARVARKVRVGDATDPETQLGPLTTRSQFERVKTLLEEAIAAGALPLSGGGAIDRPGYFIEPTILVNVQECDRIVEEEQFGPVLPVMSYGTVDEAIDRANATPYGLGASVWSSSRTRAEEVAQQLNVGTVWINTHGETDEAAPFGGVKASGLGSQLGIWSIYACTDAQTVWVPR
jgi:acyl-CoA reductase-like NAD-dependent aldehyde dehydrogenase